MRLGRGWFTRKEAAPEFWQGVSKPLSLIAVRRLMHYYSFNIGDYTSHTAHLSPIEDIAYRRLLDLYYQTESPISKDLNAVCRQIRMRDYADDVKQILSEFFTESEEGYVSSRCQSELDAYKAKADKARANGRLGGRPKKQDETENNQDGFSSFPNCNQDETQSKANHKPITNNQEPLTTKESADKSASSRLKVLRTYLDECKEQGVKPLPDEHYIRAYAEDSGITREMLGLCWVRFVEEHTEGARKAKKYKDWPQAFANAVKDNWFKFWYVRDGEVCLSSQGEIFRAAYKAKKEGGN